MSFWESIDILKIQEEKKKYETSLNQTVYTYEHNSMSQKKDSKETTNTTEKNIDIVILTAVEDEYRAVCNVFSPALIEQYENGFKYSIFSYHPDESSMTLAVFRQNEMGMVSASITATIAINKFNPKIILMCGVCAGIKGKANYGDLIVFSPVYNYEFGKSNLFPIALG